ILSRHLCSAPARTDTYTLSLHDALPISRVQAEGGHFLDAFSDDVLGCVLELDGRRHPSSLGICVLREDSHVQVVARIDVVRHLRSEEHTSELQSRFDLVCRLLLEKKKHE